MTSDRLLYLEDLAPGDEFHSGEHQIDTDQIRAFALQFDPQPFHLDEEAAKDTFFQGMAASGWHTAAISMKLFVASVPIAGGLIGAGAEIIWPRPTRPGEVLRVVSKVLEITPSRSRPECGIVKVENVTLNQRDEVCQRSVAKLLVFRREA